MSGMQYMLHHVSIKVTVGPLVKYTLIDMEINSAWWNGEAMVKPWFFKSKPILYNTVEHVCSIKCLNKQITNKQITLSRNCLYSGTFILSMEVLSFLNTFEVLRLPVPYLALVVWAMIIFPLSQRSGVPEIKIHCFQVLFSQSSHMLLFSNFHLFNNCC